MFGDSLFVLCHAQQTVCIPTNPVHDALRGIGARNIGVQIDKVGEDLARSAALTMICCHDAHCRNMKGFALYTACR